MNTSIEVLAPPASPPFSPTISADSSAPPSPRDDSFTLSSSYVPDELPLLDPFAGSMKADRPHPSYEKKSLTTPPTTPDTISPPAGPPMLRRDESPLSRIRGGSGRVLVRTQSFVTPEESRELALWEQAIASALAIDSNTGLEEETRKNRVTPREPKHTVIDLSNQGLTFIPPSISDLSKLVRLPEKKEEAAPVPINTAVKQRGLMRSATAPVRKSLFSRATTPLKVTSANATLFSDDSRPDHEIHFFFRGNAIKCLPIEVFTLSHLTVLSLSNNALETLPPEIVHLTNLKELNVGNNKLRYLPAEVLSMKLDILNVQPNDWLAEPQPKDLVLPQNQTHTVSPTISLIGRFIPLAELSLRRLFAPAHELGFCSPLDAEGRQPLLNAVYGTLLPLSSLLPPPIHATLDACSPGSVPQPIMKPLKPARPVKLDRPTKDLGDVCKYWEGVTGVGVCPAPRHLQVGSGRYRKPVFVHPAEERYTWQRTAGDHALGGVVCFLWRGCSEGCLDFLDETQGSSGQAGTEDDVDLDVVKFRPVRFDEFGDA